MHRLFPPLGGSMQTFGCSLSRDEVSSSGVRARSANIKQTVDGNTETERADLSSPPGRSPPLPASLLPLDPGCSRLFLRPPGPHRSISLKHVGSAADESGKRATQQDDHTAGTRPENVGRETRANG